MKHLVTSIFLLTTFSIQAQTENSVSVGGGLPYNFTTEQFGLNARAYYNIGKTICFGPEFVYFFPQTETIGDEEITKNTFEINFNIHYIFELTHHLGAYPVIGLNYTNEREEIELFDTKETINQDIFGANIGGGFHYGFKKATPFIEYVYIASELREHIVTAGLLFTIGGSHDHEGH